MVNTTIIKNNEEIITSYKELISLQNKIIIKLQSESKICYNNNIGESEPIKINTWCNDNHYINKYMLCSIEKSWKYLNNDLWEPLPTSMKVIIVGAPTLIVASFLGYSIYLYFDPDLIPLDPIIANEVSSLSETSSIVEELYRFSDLSQIASPAETLESIKMKAIATFAAMENNGIYHHTIEFFKNNINEPQVIATFIQKAGEEFTKMIANEYYDFNDYVAQYGGEAAAAFIDHQ